MTRLHIGQKVTRRPDTFAGMDENGNKAVKDMTGVVVYIHPKGRFHIVEFPCPTGDKVRESFLGVDAREEEKNESTEDPGHSSRRGKSKKRRRH